MDQNKKIAWRDESAVKKTSTIKTIETKRESWISGIFDIAHSNDEDKLNLFPR